MAHMCRILLHCFLITGCIVEAFDPISVTIAVAGVGGVSWVGQKLYKYRYETCDDNWIRFDSSKLEQALNKRLFGQHIASPLVLKTVTGFMKNPNPKKPLVLSLHGWSGSGKNFVGQLIAESIYHEGMESEFVHVLTATKHFPHKEHLNKYKDWLQKRVENSVRNCPRSLFIFDEMDKIQPGLIDSIKPYLDYHSNLDGVSYRKTIFLFLSNSGGQMINEIALDFWNKGRDRGELKLQDLEKPVSLSVFNTNSGFWRTSLIDKNLVDIYVPFLPLEFKHVFQCVLAEMRSRGMHPDQYVAQRMAKDMTSGESIFAKEGCKTISNRLNFYI